VPKPVQNFQCMSCGTVSACLDNRCLPCLFAAWQRAKAEVKRLEKLVVRLARA
jgi:hypothetical protein